MDAPPAPPGLPPAPPEAPPMDAPPAPPGLPPAPPEAPPMDAPPAPPGLPPAPPDAPPMDAPPAPEDDDAAAAMDLLNALDMPEEAPAEEAAPEMPPAPPMEAPPAPPMEAPPAPPLEAPPMDAPPMDAPPAPPSLDALGMPEAPVEEAAEPVVEEVPELVPPAAEPEMAGGRIRPASEVEGIPGDKLHASLAESETTKQSADGEVIKQKVKGVLTLSNPSEKDRLWDIDVVLDHTDATDIEENHLPMGELEAGADMTRDYAVSGPRMLLVRERIDTNPSRNQERSLSVVRDAEPQPIELELEVENVGPATLEDVVVTRVFPIAISVGEGAGYEKAGDTLTWEIGRLGAGEVRTISVPTSVMADSIDAIDAGHATATYRSNATLSGMTFTEVDANCRGFAYMSVDEDERPDNYRCQAIFENRSTFAVDLTNLQVTQTGEEAPLIDIADVPDDILPDGRWESEVQVIHSVAKPTFSQRELHSAIPMVQTGTEGDIEVTPLTIEVLEASIEKSYSIDVLRHFRKTDLEATMKIENTGSAVINLLRITDDVPGIFAAPDAASIRVSIDGNDLLEDQYRIETKEGISLEEHRVSPDGPGHTMLITIGTKGPIGLAPGHTMSIVYPLSAPDPSPNNDVVAGPARIDFSAERYGPVATRGLERVPAVRITHRKVNYDVGKEVFPAGGAGNYEALIMFTNRADSALRDIRIHEIIPGGFEMGDWEIRSSKAGTLDASMKEEKTAGGKKYTWTLESVDKGERVELIYMFKGEGGADYNVRAAQEVHEIEVGDEDDAGVAGPSEAPAVEEVVEEAPEEEAAEEDAAEDEEVAEEAPAEEEADEAEAPAEEAEAEAEAETEEALAEEAAAEDDGLGDMLAAISTGGEEVEEAVPEEAEAPAEEAEAEAPAEEAGRLCPICNAENPAGVPHCGTCSYAF